MATTTLSEVLQLASALPADDQELLVDLLRRRRAEAWRKDLAAYARKARRDFRAGKLRNETHEQLKARLRASLDQPLE